MARITSDIVEAYSLCPRKAFLLLRGDQAGPPHEYVRIIEEQEAANRQAYRASMAGAAGTGGARSLSDLMAGHDVILDVAVVADDLEARCDALRRAKGTAGQQECGYEPVKVLGTRRVTKSQVLGLAYFGLVLRWIPEITVKTALGSVRVGAENTIASRGSNTEKPRMGSGRSPRGGHGRQRRRWDEGTHSGVGESAGDKGRRRPANRRLRGAGRMVGLPRSGIKAFPCSVGVIIRLGHRVA
jgi:hypothetical protein